MNLILPLVRIHEFGFLCAAYACIFIVFVNSKLVSVCFVFFFLIIVIFSPISFSLTAMYVCVCVPDRFVTHRCRCDYFSCLMRMRVFKVVVITGASSGIGEALAHEFYGFGCKVVLAARRVGELERVRRNLLNTKLLPGIESIRPEILPLDLEQIQQLGDKAHQILRSNLHVDILINNGGVSLRSDALTVKQEVDVQLMNINYFGAIALTKGTEYFLVPFFSLFGFI